jgi:hypothetical protein
MTIMVLATIFCLWNVDASRQIENGSIQALQRRSMSATTPVGCAERHASLQPLLTVHSGRQNGWSL